MGETLCEERRKRELFDKYVKPNLNMVYKLCIKYSYSPAHIQDNYSDVLENFYKYMLSYDESRPHLTWMHVVIKRCIFASENKRLMEGVSVDLDEANGVVYEGIDEANCLTMNNYREHFDDDILEALDSLEEIHRVTFLLQLLGYTLDEIAEETHKMGLLRSKSIETVKSRILAARKKLSVLLNRDGTKRTA